MTEKVKLPKNVVEAIEYYRSCAFSNRSIICETESPQANQSGKDINTWLSGSDQQYDLLYQALVNGYEVEETPEDKVKKYYYDQSQRVNSRDGTDHTSTVAVIKVLNILNIKIEGVNT